MTEIWFIRHGETPWNVERRMQGWQDIALNDTGIVQARQLAERLALDAAQTPFSALYSSDLQRAHHTALPIAERLRLRIRSEPGIRERCYGVLEGVLLEEAEHKLPEAVAIWRRRDPAEPLIGGESLQQFRARIIATIKDIAARHEGERLLTVTHGGVLDVIWREANGVDLRDRGTAPLLNASINRIALDQGQWRMLDWADVAHMDATVINDVAVCGVANPRNSFGYSCGLRLASHPDPQRTLAARVLQSVPRGMRGTSLTPNPAPPSVRFLPIPRR